MFCNLEILEITSFSATPLLMENYVFSHNTCSTLQTAESYRDK